MNRIMRTLLGLAAWLAGMGARRRKHLVARPRRPWSRSARKHQQVEATADATEDAVERAVRFFRAKLGGEVIAPPLYHRRQPPRQPPP
ncbi:MAG: hypothetical protein JO000_26535 [Alphaproteobacteria bacterium]|nr:hypothetical protein [Alphaproteobacteria bacterium]